MNKTKHTLKLYAAGHRKTAIAKFLGVHRNTIRNWTKDYERLTLPDLVARLREPNDYHKLICKRFSETSLLYKPSACWIWFGGTTSKKGYGQIRYQGQMSLCSRVAYRLFEADLPDDLVAWHYCDDPLCFNPKHLFPGTHQDNMNDAKQKRNSGKK